MKTTIQSNRLANAKYKVAAMLCLTCMLAFSKNEAPASAGKALVRTPVVELRDNVLAGKRPGPQSDRVDNSGQPIAIGSRTDNAALEREERALVEAIIKARAGSVLNGQFENIKKAARSLDLATDRCKIGVGTQIGVPNAQTALTEALESYVDALQDYSVALATFIRATGADLGHL
jgi:hypothetical protein